MRPPILLRERTPALVVLAALIIMLGVHLALRTNDDLSPWKGGGFAMFSTVDSPGMRTVAVWADVAGVEERVSLVGQWDEAGRELRALPTPDRTIGSGPQRGLLDARSTCRRHSRPGDLVGGAGARARGRSIGLDWDHRQPGHQPWSRVRVSRVRVDVTKLSYDSGVMRATMLQSATADVALDG